MKTETMTTRMKLKQRVLQASTVPLGGNVQQRYCCFTDDDTDAAAAVAADYEVYKS